MSGTPPQPTRNLVLCLDGTANQFSEANTNVVKLFSVLHSSETQLNYYDSGVGTYLPQHGFNNITSFAALQNQVSLLADLAIAWFVLLSSLSGSPHERADRTSIAPTSGISTITSLELMNG